MVCLALVGCLSTNQRYAFVGTIYHEYNSKIDDRQATEVTTLRVVLFRI